MNETSVNKDEQCHLVWLLLVGAAKCFNKHTYYIHVEFN